MKVPYLQIIAFTFFRFLVTVRAVPTGDGLTALSSGLRMDKSLQDKSAQIGAALNPSKLQKPALPLPMQGRGLPVNVMQNTDESRPLVPTDHYETDVSRLAGGGPQ
ncbi:hypothetical protein BN946_scf185042.g179 [Trametes cinnabarina]|uniref:Uncharacterized protein n=1 Tax=Pycnoporus cinnabarinus TaxID=5643 RepID=A0A060S4D1_PYCCI|nr:hypothetical protein BN946_scf185042.g179 [Trametes cinnabarina]